jgi:hypothetical protein
MKIPSLSIGESTMKIPSLSIGESIMKIQSLSIGESTMKIQSLILAVILGTAAASQGAVLYQSDFTGADLASAGLESVVEGGGAWTLNTGTDHAEINDIDSVVNTRANLVTTSSWQSTGGFTLDAEFLLTAEPFRFSIGIVDADYTLVGGDWLAASIAGAYGIGFNPFGNQLNDDGKTLAFNNGTVASVLSSDQAAIGLGTTQTFSMTVTADSWSYSLNGATATSNIVPFTFDTTKDYKFISYIQGNNGDADHVNGSYFSDITLTSLTAPEPSTLALLGAGLLGLCMSGRRRRQR